MNEQPDTTGQDHIALFQQRAIRRTWHESRWWFAVPDVIAILTDSTDPAQYIKRMRLRDNELSKGWVQIVTPLPIKTEGGIQRVNCADTEGLLRIVQSIPSPKTEPLKRWLAQVGYERIKEIENPELASARARSLYEAKGYPKAWIEKRLRSIAIRGELTDEWKQRGVEEGREYAILTAEIARATFGLTPGAHKSMKGLTDRKSGENLRDHMTDLELIFSMLGEASTTEIARRHDAQGFPENRESARAGGTIAGDARKALEAKSGKPVVSTENYLRIKGQSSSEFARAAFIETQTEALTVGQPVKKAVTRKRVTAKVDAAIAEMQGEPAVGKKARKRKE